MAEQFYTILTNVGKAKIANASVLGTKVNFTHFAVGDGNGNYYNPTEDQTALKNEVWRGQIGNITVDEENPNWIKLETIIPANAGGFTIREAGAFDDEGNLLAIGKYPETYKPQVQDGSAKDLYVKMILEVANTSVVTLKVDPAIILATKKDIDILSNRIDEVINEVNKKETPVGAQEKADKAETNAKAYANFVAEQAETNAKEYTNQAVGALAGEGNTKTVKQLEDELAAHKADTENPHNVTKSQVGLENVDNVKQMPLSGGEFTGIAKAYPNTSHTVAQMRNIILSPEDANIDLMSEGDIWIKYI